MWPRTRNEVIATPVVVGDVVYLANGQDPEHGEGVGHFYAIDGTQRGDITDVGLIWHFDTIRRSISTAAVADGLVYIADFSGYLHCLDAETGELQWTYDTFAAVWASPFVVDGKVYLGDEDGDVVVLEHGRTMNVLAEMNMGSAVYGTIVPRQQRDLPEQPQRAVQAGPGLMSLLARAARVGLVVLLALWLVPALSAQAPADAWSQFRGSPALTGVSASVPPADLELLWTYDVGDVIESSPAVVGDVVYLGAGSGDLLALDLDSGELLWSYTTGNLIGESSPAVADGTVYVGDLAGVLHAVDAADGHPRWTFETEAEIRFVAGGRRRHGARGVVRRPPIRGRCRYRRAALEGPHAGPGARDACGQGRTDVRGRVRRLLPGHPDRQRPGSLPGGVGRVYGRLAHPRRRPSVLRDVQQRGPGARPGEGRGPLALLGPRTAVSPSTRRRRWPTGS